MMHSDDTDRNPPATQPLEAEDPTPTPAQRRTRAVPPVQVPPQRLPPRAQPARPGLMPPWWAFALMLIVVLGCVSAVVLAVFALGNSRAVSDTGPSMPRLMVTPANTLPGGQAVTILATPTLPEAFVPDALQTPVIFALDGPTLPPPNVTPTPAPVEIGRTVLVIDVGDQQLNVRDQPGVSGTTVVFRAPETTQWMVVDGPRQADGLTWWRIQAPDDPARSGWAASNYLQALPDE